MAEFMRALKTLKALQAEQAATERPAATPMPMRVQPSRPAAHPECAHLPRPNEPEHRSAPRRARGAGPQFEYLLPDPPAAGRMLHEPAAPWIPNEPDRLAAEPAHAKGAAARDPRVEPPDGGGLRHPAVEPTRQAVL
jgi:hypothetical protein